MSRIIGCGNKSGVTCQVERQGERGREGKKKKRGEKKVDLPVAQLLAAHSRYYLLRLESPVSQGRTAEEAKYVTGDRQVSDRAGWSVGISASEGKFVFGSVLSIPPSPQIYRGFFPISCNCVRFG